MSILEAQNITAGYTAEVNILTDVNLRLKAGQIVSVIGPNGAGKSTLLKTIFGILKPSSGKISLKDEDITGANIRRAPPSAACNESSPVW